MCAQSLSCVRLFAPTWTVAPPGSSAHGIFQIRILAWVEYIAGSFPWGLIGYYQSVSEVAVSFRSYTGEGSSCKFIKLLVEFIIT